MLIEELTALDFCLEDVCKTINLLLVKFSDFPFHFETLLLVHPIHHVQVFSLGKNRKNFERKYKLVQHGSEI